MYNILLRVLTFFKRSTFQLLIITAIAFLIFLISFHNHLKIISRGLYHLYGPAQDIETEEIRNDILFKMQPENNTIQSFIRATKRKALINKITIDTSKLPGKYRYNSTDTNMEKMQISSECITIYPFNESEELVVKQSNYQQVRLQTPYGNTPIALHGAGDVLSYWLQSGVSFEPQLKEGILSFLNADPRLAFLDLGAMLGALFLFKKVLYW